MAIQQHTAIAPLAPGHPTGLGVTHVQRVLLAEAVERAEGWPAIGQLIEGVDFTVDLRSGEVSRPTDLPMVWARIVVEYDTAIDPAKAAALASAVADLDAFREQLAAGLSALDQVDQHTAAIEAAASADLDTIGELRGALKLLAADVGRIARIQRRTLRALARVLGAVPPEA